MKRTAWIVLAVLVAGVAGPGCGGPAAPDELVNLAVADLQTGRIDRARAMLTRALDQSPSHARALFYMGRLHHAEKFYEQAVYYYQCCLDADPGYVAARTHLAEAQKLAGAAGDKLRFIPDPLEY
ncbi:hypothetical protein LCGC14_2390130 [marine sediment metagenome]|uniref:Uncharacterized protein n=1 Tax=marine sediment metagenome TaxID=412755 RepID=A0A0F9ESY5_9ZZZZ